MELYEPPVVLARERTERGELVLRKSDDRFEIISNGVFLMDTSDGTSERLLVEMAVARCKAPAPRLLIGGLGVGFSLARAVAYVEVATIDVIEIERTVIDWHDRHLAHITGAALADPRVRVIASDILDWLAGTADRYDAICLDTDNGPNWLVFEDNVDVYTSRGLDLVERCLAPDGVLAVWSASRDPSYEDLVRTRLGELDVVEVPRERGAPDVIYVARRSST